MVRPPSKPGTEFGKRLASARKKAGLTQIQFGELAGMSQKMVDHYERRCPDPRLSIVVRSAKALGINVLELIGETPPPEGK